MNNTYIKQAAAAIVMAFALTGCTGQSPVAAPQAARVTVSTVQATETVVYAEALAARTYKRTRVWKYKTVIRKDATKYSNYTRTIQSGRNGKVRVYYRNGKVVKQVVLRKARTKIVVKGTKPIYRNVNTATAFTTTYRNSSTMTKGTQKVIQNGVTGLVVSKYKYGKLIYKVTVRAPKAKIIMVGTETVPAIPTNPSLDDNPNHVRMVKSPSGRVTATLTEAKTDGEYAMCRYDVSSPNNASYVLDISVNGAWMLDPDFNSRPFGRANVSQSFSLNGWSLSADEKQPTCNAKLID